MFSISTFLKDTFSLSLVVSPLAGFESRGVSTSSGTGYFPICRICSERLSKEWIAALEVGTYGDLVFVKPVHLSQRSALAFGQKEE